MSRAVGLWIITPILLTIIGELILKFSLNQLPTNVKASLFLTLGHSGVFLGIACIGISGLLWIVALSRFQLSYLYPFASVTYVSILIGSSVILGERITIPRGIAAALIMVGLWVISKSPNVESNPN